MLKKIAAALLLLLAATPVLSDEAAIRKVMQATFPKQKLVSISKTPINGIYEVVVGEHIIYTNDDASHFITEGHLWDVKEQRDLTAERRDELDRIDFATLPLDLAIKDVRGNGSRRIAVFSDPDCPFCKRLEKEGFRDLTDVTIYTFLFPLPGHPDAPAKSRAIWCSQDKLKAWHSWMLKGFLPQGSSACVPPLEKISALAKKVGVDSTPILFFSDGSRLRGAYPAEDIAQALENAAKKQSK